jgi:phosphohistidine phosphatase
VKLLVIRHGPAGDRDAWTAQGRDDRLRPLTADGKKEMRQVAKGLATLVPEIELIATSSLVRATQTAEIVADQYGSETVTLEPLAPGGEPDEIVSWLREQRSTGTIALVGHEPDLSALVSHLLARAPSSFVTLKKSGACLLQLDQPPKPGRATLTWLLTPRVLRQLANSA